MLGISDRLTFLQLSTVSEADLLVVRHLGDGVAEEDELVVRLGQGHLGLMDGTHVGAEWMPRRNPKKL